MPRINFYDNSGLGQYTSGNLTRSDYTALECIFPYSTPLYAQATYAFAANFPVSTTTAFNLTITQTQETYSGNVVVGATLDQTSIVNQINQILPHFFTAKWDNAANTLVIDSAIPGVNGNFTTDFTATASQTPTDPGVIRPGRLVVPRTNYSDMSANKRITNNPYRYPTVGDSADLLMAAVLTIKDAHTNAPSLNSFYDIGQITQGTCFAGLYRGEMVLQPITAVNGTTALFVETSGVNAGRLTANASASTLAIPNGKLRVVSGGAANQNIRVQIL